MNAPKAKMQNNSLVRFRLIWKLRAGLGINSHEIWFSILGGWWLGRNWNWDSTGKCGTETQMGNHWSTTRNDLLTSHTFLDLSEMEMCSCTKTVKTLLSLTRSLKHYLLLYVKWNEDLFNAHLLNGSVVDQKFVADQIKRRLDSWG